MCAIGLAGCPIKIAVPQNAGRPTPDPARRVPPEADDPGPAPPWYADGDLLYQVGGALGLLVAGFGTRSWLKKRKAA